MATPNGSRGAVLVIDPDESIRKMLEVVLQRAGFTVECAALGEGLRPRLEHRFDVVVRDVNLAPPARERSLQELERSALTLLQQTVVTTTGSAAMLRQRGITAPFAVVRKPFDLDILVETVGRCCERSGRHHSTGGAGKADDEDVPPAINLSGVHRFVGSVPALRALVANETASMPELLLRNELRRVALQLAEALGEVSAKERDRTRAAVLRAAARVAAELSALPAPQLRRVRHDH